MATAVKTDTSFYNPITSIVITVVAFLGSQIVGAFLFGSVLLLLPQFKGLSGSEMQNELTDNRWLYLLLIVAVEALAVAVILWFMKKRHISVRQLGVGSFQLSYAGKALLGYGVVMGLNVVLLGVLGMVVPNLDLAQKQDLGLGAVAGGGYSLVPLFVSLVLIPPFVEEFIMRGFLFTNLRTKLSFVWSSVVVSVLFGLAHITQADSGLFWSGAISFFVLSMVLCYLREKTGSLWPGVGVHMIQNGLAFTLLYVIKVV